MASENVNSNSTTPSHVTRRDVLAGAALAAASMTLGRALAQSPTSTPSPAGAAQSPAGDSTIARWIEGTPPQTLGGVTWTVPWPCGQIHSTADLTVLADGQPIAADTWPLAYWPDGSVKWSAHAAALPSKAPAALSVERGTPPAPQSTIKVTSIDGGVLIDTGVLRCTLATSGPDLIRQIEVAGKPVLTAGRLVAHLATSPEPGQGTRQRYVSSIRTVTAETGHTLRTVVKIEGVHVADDAQKGTEVFPFVVRLYFYAGSDRIRIVHSFIYDRDENKEFLAGLGLTFQVPLRDELYDRHIRFVGDDHGLLGEAVRGITGLRRDPGQTVREAQVAGQKTPPISEWNRSVVPNLQYIPAWGDYRLTQLAPDGFLIQKRTKQGHAWIQSGAGHRAAGTAYVGGASGGVAFGLRDFWQRCPTELSIANAHTDAATVTLWMYSPSAQPLDMRFYHDGLGQDTYAKQNAGLDITYEDYEPGYGTPYGIARTSELFLWATASTPSRDDIAGFADVVRKPPQLLCHPARYLGAGVFGGIWTLPDTSSTPVKAGIEAMLTQVMEQYIRDVDQRRWFGFWDFGDVMHTYDSDRHTWRYDVGGFAWDNSELSPDLFFWTMVLRTARPDYYRFAEAHVRHTGEVDVYHIGRFAGLGTRHNVQHWGCSSKQTRISTSIYRRHFYFLTADERVGDLLRAQVTEGETFKKIVIGRKVGATDDTPSLPLPPVENAPPGGKIGCGAMGWGNIMSAWLTEAERTGDKAWHDRIRTSLRTIAALPKGLYTENWKLDLDTGEVTHDGPVDVGVSHLTACFGLPEISAELIRTYPEEGKLYAETWAQYGILYNAPAAERDAALGKRLKGFSLNDSHSRATAFAAWWRKDPQLAARAWKEYFGPEGTTRFTRAQRESKHLQGPDVLLPIDEIPLGTNGAQSWLASLQNLHYIGESCPSD
jgi:hypothetical protein